MPTAAPITQAADQAATSARGARPGNASRLVDGGNYDDRGHLRRASKVLERGCSAELLARS